MELTHVNFVPCLLVGAHSSGRGERRESRWKTKKVDGLFSTHVRRTSGIGSSIKSNCEYTRGRNKRIFHVWRFQEEDKEEMKEILEMKRTHERLLKKRQNRTLKEKILV